MKPRSVTTLAPFLAAAACCLSVLAADQAYGKRLGEAARERTSKEFTLQGFSRRVEEFYKFLLAGSAPKLSTISDPQMVGADADCEGAGAKI